MTTPMLATKLYAPPPQPNLVDRMRLINRLDQGLQRKLTLVSAPAGFGKTTLVSTWAQHAGCPMAWLALDAEESNPTRFLSYLIAALQTINPTLGQGILRLLQAPQPPATDLLLTTLLNELLVTPQKQLLVLDDYHLVDAPAIDEMLRFLLDHLPAQLHLVIVTREDPNLPLAGLRARGQLMEVRANDLRFTVDEATSFLTQMLGFPLDIETVIALEARTEGWIAGLQLAAISLQGHQTAGTATTTDFIASFTGSHRFVMDYLVEEVLQQQEPAVEHFLLYTSLLERICGPLCDALMETEPGTGQAMLDRLETANMFLVPLDSERRWYRYHHLFAELLRQRLDQQEDADLIAAHHRRAAAWYEAAGLELDAFHHATAAHDIDHAIRLAEGKEAPLHFRGALPSVQQWLQTLSPEQMDARPVLWVLYGSILTMTGQPTPDVEKALCAAEAALARDDINLSKAKIDDLHGNIASLRAMLGIPISDADRIREQSQRALEFLAPDNLPIRTSATWTLGFAYQLKGDRTAAARVYQDAIAMSEQSGNMMMIMAAATCLGQVQESETQLAQAVDTFQQVLRVAGDPPWPAACEAHHGLGRIYYQWNQLETAQEHAEQGLRLAKQLPNVDTPATCMVLLARIKLARGDVAGAEQQLHEAEQFLVNRQYHQLPIILTELRISILLQQGAVTDATRCIQQNGEQKELSGALLPLRARVLLAQEDAAGALAILRPIYTDRVVKGWRDEQITLLILQALAHHQQKETEQALSLLADALTLAEAGNYIRLFLDEGMIVGEGAAMAQLLQHLAARNRQYTYATTLLATFATAPQSSTTGSGTVAPSPSSLPPIAAQSLVEPLSERELEVLILIAQGHSNREIGERLHIALDTVKGHNRKIFGKLQVQRRTEAVAQARALGLL